MSSRISGSKPVLQASASSTAQMLVATSPARAPPSLAWVNPAAKPVRACISNSNSGRSTRGIRASTAVLSATRLGGSSSLSRAVKDKLVAVHPHTGVLGQVGGRGAVGRVQPLGSDASISAPASIERPSVRQMAGRAASHAGPASRPRRGSA